MISSAWGPPAWTTFHTIAYNYSNLDSYTEEIKQNYKEFFRFLGKVLPCRYCRESYAIFTKMLPIDPYLQYPMGPMYWSYLIHNMVNDKLRKQGNLLPPNPPFALVCEHYKKLKSKKCKKPGETTICSNKSFTCSHA